MIRVLGIDFMFKASSLERICSPSKGNRGNCAGLEPVAMIILSAPMISVEPSFFWTSILSGLMTMPLPSIRVIPQLLNKERIPLTCVETTLFFLSMILERFGVICPEMSMPNSPQFFILCKSSVVASNVLVGIQPLLRQVPPTSVSSMTVTCAPSWADLIAATYPPGPAPRMASFIFFPLQHIFHIQRRPSDHSLQQRHQSRRRLSSLYRMGLR